MAERSFGMPVLTIGGLLAIVAALFRAPASTPSQQEKQNDPPATIAKDTSRRAYQTGNDLLVAHLGHLPGTGEDDTLGILIATLPDPVDSHEYWMYDAHLEAFAAGSRHSLYFLDPFWLPCRPTHRPSCPPSPTRRVPTREGMPGVMLFLETTIFACSTLWASSRRRASAAGPSGGPWTNGTRFSKNGRPRAKNGILRSDHRATFPGSGNSAQEVVEAWLQRHDSSSNTAVLVSGMATSLLVIAGSTQADGDHRDHR